MSLNNYNDSDAKVVSMAPAVFLTGLAIIVLAGLALMFHEAVGDWFTGLRPATADSLRGEWVGELDVPNIRDPYIRPVHKRAIIRFSLSPTEHFLHKYGGDGEITIANEAPLPIQVKDLWPSDSGDTKPFEASVWKVPYHEGDRSDLISGGFEGSFSPGTLTFKRQTDLGYDMEGILHKGTDQKYSILVKKMNAKAAK